MDVPKIDAKFLKMHNIHGPYGAKGISEMPNIVTPAAVNNAIANAIGARFYELPIDSEFVWRTIQEMTKK
jgi:xanthine dehydrogenase molybdenum-binding subunit